jgi:hypothetical protein
VARPDCNRAIHERVLLWFFKLVRRYNCAVVTVPLASIDLCHLKSVLLWRSCTCLAVAAEVLSLYLIDLVQVPAYLALVTGLPSVAYFAL